MQKSQKSLKVGKPDSDKDKFSILTGFISISRLLPLKLKFHKISEK